VLIVVNKVDQNTELKNPDFFDINGFLICDNSVGLLYFVIGVGSFVVEEIISGNLIMRRRKSVKRQLTPDVKYNSELVARLINTIMNRGKKSTSQGIVYGAFEVIKAKKSELEPLEVFLQALENVKPRLEVKSRRVGGATYQVPIEVDAGRQVALALRWITTYAKTKKGQPMKDALASEILDAFENTGSSVKKKEDTHKMAQANKAFAHYRW
jgi:small subunit ribosomal protein S7